MHFLEWNGCIPIKISLRFVPKGSINNIRALLQIMAWCRQGDKPLSEPMMVSLPTHICVAGSHWVNWGSDIGHHIHGFLWDAFTQQWLRCKFDAWGHSDIIRFNFDSSPIKPSWIIDICQLICLSQVLAIVNFFENHTLKCCRFPRVN